MKQKIVVSKGIKLVKNEIKLESEEANEIGMNIAMPIHLNLIKNLKINGKICLSFCIFRKI